MFRKSLNDDGVVPGPCDPFGHRYPINVLRIHNKKPKSQIITGTCKVQLHLFILGNEMSRSKSTRDTLACGLFGPAWH